MPIALPTHYKVLMVDDSADDRFFLRHVLNRFPRFALVGEVEDGEEAISYLAGIGKYSARQEYPIPDLMLLDLKMPRRNGFEVLQWLHTQWRPRITVIVLSSSNLAEDVGASLALGAKGFWTKTANPKRQDAIVKEVEILLDTRWEKWNCVSDSFSSKPRHTNKAGFGKCSVTRKSVRKTVRDL